MYVAPSLLSADFGRLNDEIAAVCEAGADLLHLDIMDGHFVPNLTFGAPVMNAIKKAAKVPLDIHLMVENLDFFVDYFLDFKPKFLSFHIERATHPLRLIEHIRKAGVSPAVVLNPHTSLSTLEYILSEIDMVLLMSVNPGFGGQSFMENSLDKVKWLKEYKDENDLNYIIEIDGGVSDSNCQRIVEAGAEALVAGSYVFKGDMEANIVKMEKMCE